MQQKFSEKRSDRQEENEELRRKILGMGERSFRKSYYPELQEKLSDLERYKALLDQSNDAIFLINMSTGKFLNVSQSACRQIGYSEEECILMTMYDIVSDDEELLDNFFSEAADSMIFDTRIRKSSGEEAPYEINIRRVQFGGIDYGIAVARDISQRMRYEESLRLTQFALDKFSDSAVWLSTDGAIIYINENTCRQLGYAREELLSMHIWDIDPNYGPDRYAETIAELRRGVGTLKFESRYKTRDGRVFPVEVACSYIRYNNKEYVISFDRDISERKQAEEVLHRSEERYRIVADNTYDWEFWLDTDKKFIYISPSCQRITGYAASEFIADPDLYFNIIHPADQKLFRDHNNEVYNKKTTGELEFRVIRRDGGLRWIHHLCQPVFDMQGRYLGARGSNRDSTERKNAENELKEAKAQAELYL
ncbi:MAG TPA: PAS domain S-box protein, partial [Methanocella sp.]|nr:PAS domain S-box protein [Methanocella sp.]